MNPVARQRDQKLARIDRELATLAARQAALYAERASLFDNEPTLAPAPRRQSSRPTPQIGPVSDLAQQRAVAALRELRTGRKVRP